MITPTKEKKPIFEPRSGAIDPRFTTSGTLSCLSRAPTEEPLQKSSDSAAKKQALIQTNPLKIRCISNYRIINSRRNDDIPSIDKTYLPGIYDAHMASKPPTANLQRDETETREKTTKALREIKFSKQARRKKKRGKMSVNHH